MNSDEKATVALNLAHLALMGTGIGIGLWFASDMGTWAWVFPIIFLIGFAAWAYMLWLRIEMIVCRVRIEEIDGHIANLDAIRAVIDRRAS